MDKIEKVLHGLSSCGNDYGTPNICEVTECPYREIEVSCVHSLAHDAMMLISELLKAQEPRVMTLEEVKALSEDDLVWYEHVGINKLRPRVVYYTDYSCIVFTDGGKWYFELDGYGKQWRCWTAKSTEEQRKVAKWDDVR